jgi:hypothetical protein
MAPIVVREGELVFLIHPREYPFEPAHVHVIGGGSEVRIMLSNGSFMDAPDPGKRRSIALAYRKYAERIMNAWIKLHGERR